MNHNNSKPCDCRFCSQFYFMRMKKYNYDKTQKLIKLQNNNKDNKDNKDNTDNNTLKDLDKISLLKSQNSNTEEIL